MTVYLLATLDTKGREAAFVRDRLRELGVEVALVDTGCIGQSATDGRTLRVRCVVKPERSQAMLLERLGLGATATSVM